MILTTNYELRITNYEDRYTLCVKHYALCVTAIYVIPAKAGILVMRYALSVKDCGTENLVSEQVICDQLSVKDGTLASAGRSTRFIWF